MSVLQKEKPQPDKNEKGLRIITENFCKKLCQYNGGYESPELNMNLYLHFQGFRKIENLDSYINLKVLYLENNSIGKIEGLDKLTQLECLYLQNNYIKKIENLDNNVNLSILNLSANKISKIENLTPLQKLENLYIAKNDLSTADDLSNILTIKSLSLLDIQNNNFTQNPNELLDLFEKCENLKVLYLKNNEICRSINNYRRTIIIKLKFLTYLDDKPVKKEDRVGAIAYLKGGYQAEKIAREKFREENDRVIQTRKREKKMLEISFDERKKNAIKNLEMECDKRNIDLNNIKNSIINDSDFQNQRKKNVYLSCIDYELYENKNFEQNEKKLIQLTIAKRERVNQEILFDYEDWMDDIIEIKILENCFNFNRALIGIQEEFKNKNVNNYLLFSEMDLRNKWTELEMKKFRKENDETFYFLQQSDVYSEDIINQMKNLKKEGKRENKKIEENKKSKENKEMEEKVKEDENNVEENKGNGGFNLNIVEGDVNEEDVKGFDLIEKHNEGPNKKNDLDELD